MITIDSYVTITDNEMDMHKLDDEWVVVDKNQEKVAVMNETAFFIWQAIQKETRIEVRELYCRICGKFPEVDRIQIERDVLEVVNLMLIEQLLYEL